MTKRQSNKLNMYNAVIAFLKGNNEVYASLAVMQTQVTEFESKVQKIINTESIRESIKAGKTMDKLKEEKELEDILNKVMAALNVYAQLAGNNEIKEETDYSLSDLRKMRDNELLEKGYAIYNKAAGLKTELAAYAVGEDEIESIKTNADEFAEAMGLTGAAGAESKEKTTELKTLFDNADDLLYSKIDKLIEIFKSSNKTFYDGYFNARQIIDR